MGLNMAQKKERSRYLETNLRITECSQRNPYAFISYASDNWETVFKTAVVPLQERHGLRVYADKAFDKVNDKWIVPMLRNVRGADLMIAFVSQSYIESYACFLELLTAVNSRKQIVFVSLGEQLHLGDTTDQPSVERGAKNEILNQGSNLATNTNNTSNDIMRAMKSAYTSLSTLLEQDALSKYDISDAFINFFRDASINQKTIHDLDAVLGTIRSISGEVFDPSLIAAPVPNAGIAATVQAHSASAPLSDAEPVVEDSEDMPAYEAPEAQMPQQEAENIHCAAPVPNAGDRRHGGDRLGRYIEKLKKNRHALMSLVLGILSFVCISSLESPHSMLSIPSCILGVIFGVRAVRAGVRNTLSIAGLIISAGMILIFTIFIVAAIVH